MNKTHYTVGAVAIVAVLGFIIANNIPSEIGILREAMAQNDHRLEDFTKEYTTLEQERLALIEEAEQKAVRMTQIRDEAKLVRDMQVEMQMKINSLIKGGK